MNHVRGQVSGASTATSGANLRSATAMSPWGWIWPVVGPAPITQGLDAEMFDRADYPYSETFVREAIQNTLDARNDLSRPAIIRFRFHEAAIGPRRAFLSEAIAFRQKVGLKTPPEWGRDRIDWLTIEDFNTRGLGGNLSSRTSDFWNYWLNFGVSNKDGRGRGGRGIGRITFLIASRIHTVLGLTRRVEDNATAACAMCVLRLYEDGDGYHATHAYLARATWDQKSIYHLHDGNDFHHGMREEFGFEGYSTSPNLFGLALAIPYPHPELKPKGILAAAIEHFAPAIMNGSLVAEVDDFRLDADSIAEIATGVADSFNADAIREDVDRYLDLVSSGLDEDTEELEVNDLKAGLTALHDTPLASSLRKIFDRTGRIALTIRLPLRRNGRTAPVSLRAIVARVPAGKLPIDRLYREGMSLPDVRTKSPGEADAIILVDDGELATYLNFCEGKAHLDLLGSKETKTKLEDNGFATNLHEMQFVRNLCRSLRSFLTPETNEPDANVFDTFFARPMKDEQKQTGKGPRPTKEPVDPPPPPEPKIAPFKIEQLSDGFRMRANPDFTDWPVNVSATIAYADGTRKPRWSEYDFRLSNLTVEHTGCTYSAERNTVEGKDCRADCQIQITGFDARRELDVRIGVTRNAQKD